VLCTASVFEPCHAAMGRRPSALSADYLAGDMPTYITYTTKIPTHM
jgi:hypothetical protein